MFNLSFKSILKETKGYPKNIPFKEIEIKNIVIDDKDVSKNSVFIAIIGKNFNGHDFVPLAFKKGAAFAITEKEVANFPQIVVKNTREAFLKIASLNRSFFNGFLFGITGSVGKTSTKDMLAIILNDQMNTLKTIGNLNNDIGVPKTLLNLSPLHKAAVIEMGMSALGEIKVLSKAARPTAAIITNIGISHIEFLKTKENILKAKLEILEGMPKNSNLFLNGDDEYLKNLKLKDNNIVFCGIKNKNAAYSARNIKQVKLSTQFDLYEENEFKTTIVLPTLGKHNILNSLLVIAASHFIKISFEEIKDSLKKFVPSAMRQNIFEKNGIIILSDCYNASPQSVVAAIKTLKKIAISSNRKIAILGSMLELGEISKQEHFKIGQFVAKNKIDALWCLGEETKEMVKGATKENKNFDVKYFTTRQDLIDHIKKNAKLNDIMLFKASLGMNFKEIITNSFF